MAYTTTALSTLSLHDALPISGAVLALEAAAGNPAVTALALYEPPFVVDDWRPPLPASYLDRLTELLAAGQRDGAVRSEEHTSELQSHVNLVCRLLLEKKKVI